MECYGLQDRAETLQVDVVCQGGTDVWNELATIALDGWPDRFNRFLPLA